MARRSGRGRARYDWALSVITSLTHFTPAATQAVAFIATTAETLVRIRGEVLVWLDLTGSVAGDSVNVAYGLIVAPRGSTVGSSPITDGNANWLGFGVATLAAETAVGNVGAPTEYVRMIIDLKSMRKLREDEDIFVVYETADVIGAPVVNFVGSFRALSQISSA